MAQVAVTTIENAGLINDYLALIISQATGGILGNARASLVDIKVMAEEAQRVFQLSVIEKR